MEDYSENSDEVGNSSFCFEEAGRGCRNKKRLEDPTCCPVCSLTIRDSEISMHLSNEIEKLNKLPSTKVKVLNGATSKNSPSSSSSSNGSTDVCADKNWETYQKVRSNRQNRQRTKTRKRKAEDVTCPICNKEVSEDINLHVEVCLRRSENNSDDEENIDIETFEEYEWAGQSRIRVTSLLPGGVSCLGVPLANTEEDEDLNVDGDDTQTYGAPQYFERDIILSCGDPADVALRKAVIGSDPKRLNSDDKNHTKVCTSETNGDPILEVLKNKIRELEARLENKDEVYKCLICMERYHTPVISVCCWHVHCEQCWLQTLGAKKLCPQCNMITSPADLRRIYM